MRNERYQERAANARFYACPSTIVAGDPVLIGGLPGVALESYSAAKGGTTFRFSGTYKLPVHAATSVSPAVGSAMKQGDTIYAAGTLDAATNVTHGLTLSKDTGGVKFGTYDDPTEVTSGTLASEAPVKLRENAA